MIACRHLQSVELGTPTLLEKCIRSLQFKNTEHCIKKFYYFYLFIYLLLLFTLSIYAIGLHQLACSYLLLNIIVVRLRPFQWASETCIPMARRFREMNWKINVKTTRANRCSATRWSAAVRSIGSIRIKLSHPSDNTRILRWVFFGLFYLYSSFVCSLNPICRTFMPHPYAVITLLSFHHGPSQPSQCLSVPSCAYTRLLNKIIVENGLSRLRLSQSRARHFGPNPGLCEFIIKTRNWQIDGFVTKRSRWLT